MRKFLGKVLDYMRLARVKHYIKNLLIFMPLLFSIKTENHIIISSILGFISFSLMCSVVYIVNDIKDIKIDKKNKKDRPLAKGKITINNALIFAFILLILSIIVNYFTINIYMSYTLLFTYLFLNFLYTFYLKNIPIIDILLLTVFYVIRVYYGGIITDSPISSWMYLTIMCAAFAASLGKRKKEIGKNERHVLKYYNEVYLDKFMFSNITLTICFYSLWAISQANKYIAFSIPILIVILMRYFLIVETGKEGDPTQIIYKDKMLLSLCIIYGIFMILVMYI